MKKKIFILVAFVLISTSIIIPKTSTNRNTNVICSDDPRPMMKSAYNFKIV